jgi:alginate O-acetyltransferase complex protein AlgI
MVFSSLLFLFQFLPLFLLIYFISPKKVKNLILFLFSLLFYAWGEPIYICLMLFSTIFDYTNGLLIEHFGLKNIKSKIVLIIDLIGNLGLLFVFKYYDFFIGNINNIFNLDLGFLGVALPIGISFYTFQTMSYTIDVYKGVVPAQHNIISFGAYVSMFPQLIAGPIVQYKTISEELNERSINIGDIYYGIKRFCIGLGKKVILANNLGVIWTMILENMSEYGALTLWLGVVCFAFQIYFDFSGYSDMAIGLGRILGFKFLENFNYPYISKSITEFWRRWHISLGTWFREYVYIPLGGNRCNLLKNIRNIFVVWFLTGFWHGASWNYVIWGLYFFILLILEKFILNKYLEKCPNIIRHIYTIFFVLISWVIFSIEDMNILGDFIVGLFNNSNGFVDNNFMYLVSNNVILLVISLIASLGVFNQYYEIGKVKSKWLVYLEYVSLIIIFIASVSLLVNTSYNPFLYFRF